MRTLHVLSQILLLTSTFGHVIPERSFEHIAQGETAAVGSSLNETTSAVGPTVLDSQVPVDLPPSENIPSPAKLGDKAIDSSEDQDSIQRLQARSRASHKAKRPTSTRKKTKTKTKTGKKKTSSRKKSKSTTKKHPTTTKQSGTKSKHAATKATGAAKHKGTKSKTGETTKQQSAKQLLHKIVQWEKKFKPKSCKIRRNLLPRADADPTDNSDAQSHVSAAGSEGDSLGDPEEVGMSRAHFAKPGEAVKAVALYSCLAVAAKDSKGNKAVVHIDPSRIQEDWKMFKRFMTTNKMDSADKPTLRISIPDPATVRQGIRSPTEQNQIEKEAEAGNKQLEKLVREYLGKASLSPSQVVQRAGPRGGKAFVGEYGFTEDGDFSEFKECGGYMTPPSFD